MSPDLGIRTSVFARGALAAFICLTATAAMAQSTQGTATPLVGTYWKAIELAGTATPVQNANREAHLQFQTDGRVSGSDGCNRTTGSYTLNGENLRFGRMAGTQMACANTAGTERMFGEVLQGTSRWRIVGDRLELFSAAGTRLAIFASRAQTPPQTASLRLQGTSWQLVKFQGSDDTARTPDERAKYTIAFGADGRLSARIDCNRGQGTWKASGSTQLELGPLALTRASCPPESMHDQIVKQWSFIRGYVIKDGHLFLALMADGGIYEFEPLPVGAK